LDLYIIVGKIAAFLNVFMMEGIIYNSFNIRSTTPDINFTIVRKA